MSVLLEVGKAQAVKVDYVLKFDLVNNVHIANAFEQVWDQLDFGPCDAELAKLDRKLEFKLEADINAVLNDHVDAALWLGWQAAKNPAAWLFDEDGGLQDETPSNLFEYKMTSLGLGDENIFNLEGELGKAITALFARAETLAFALGMELQRNPERLVFGSEGK